MRKFIAFIVPILLLTSCEGFIHLQGHAYDNETQKPVDNVEVQLLYRGKDTIRNIRLQYDTISYDQRRALRKKGIKDDYSYYDAMGLSRWTTSSTDSSGHFYVGNILVPCVPKCPTCRLVFIKKGYKPLVLKPGSIYNDSIQVCLEKTETP